MGIPKLNSFVEDNFRGWKRQVVTGPLVIDGNNIRHHLYNFDWSRGGQLHEFYHRVIQYYKGLLTRGVAPIVVLDGIDHTGEKHATIVRRQKFRISTIRNYILNEHAKPEKCSQGIFPALGSNVYIQALSDLQISYVVVDGEADDAMVRISNYYNCPLLSSDSDFYMYKLNAGYIKTDQLHRQRDHITADVYHYENFCGEFHFRDHSCRFIIPALVGGDVIPSVVDTRNHEEFFDRGALHQFADDDLIRSVVNYASSFESLPAFLDAIRSTFSKGRVNRITENCQKSLEIYNSDETYRIEDIHNFTELYTKNGNNIPWWVIESFRIGHFSKCLISNLVVGRYIFDTFIDNPNRESCVVLSRPIRRFIYRVLGLDSAVEHFRVEYHLSEEEIPSCSLLKDGLSLPSLHQISSLTQLDREDLVCRALGCNERVISAQEEHLKLVLASTMFWYRESQPPSHVVESLLLCMLICFYRPHLLFQHYDNAIEFRSSSEWIDNLHSFAQWQCCYKDAISLNELFMCPYRVTCPSQLFDGKLVMHLSQLRGITAYVVQSFRILTGQYFRLLDIILNQAGDMGHQVGRFANKSRATGGHMSAHAGAHSSGFRPSQFQGGFPRSSAEYEEEPLSWRSRDTVCPVSTSSRSCGRGGFTKHSADDFPRDADVGDFTDSRSYARGHDSFSKPSAKVAEDKHAKSVDIDGFETGSKSHGRSSKHSAKVTGGKRTNVGGDDFSSVSAASPSGDHGGSTNHSARVTDGSTKHSTKDKHTKDDTSSKSHDRGGRPTKSSAKVTEDKVAANKHAKGDSVPAASKSRDRGGSTKHSAKVTDGTVKRVEESGSSPVTTASKSRRRGGGSNKHSAKVAEDKRTKDTGKNPAPTSSKSPRGDSQLTDASSNSKSRDQDRPASKSRSTLRQSQEGAKGHGSTSSTSRDTDRPTNQTHGDTIGHASQSSSAGELAKDAPNSASQQSRNPSGRRSGYRGRGIRQQSRSSHHKDSSSHGPKSGKASQSQDGDRMTAQVQKQSVPSKRGSDQRPVQSQQQSQQQSQGKTVTKRSCPDTAGDNVRGGPSQGAGQQPIAAVPQSSEEPGHRGRRRRRGRGRGTTGSGGGQE